MTSLAPQGLSIALLVALVGCAAEAPPKAPNEVTLPTLSAEERSASAAATLELAWSDVIASHPSAIRPETEFVRFVFPNEWAETRAQCLNDAGLAATVSSDGGVELRVASGQGEVTELAKFVCAAQYPMDPIANEDLNESQLALAYWYYTHELRDCLEGEGIQVDNVPSLAVFKQHFYTDDSWSPYASVPEGVDWEGLNSRCPQAAPGLYGTGT